VGAALGHAAGLLTGNTRRPDILSHQRFGAGPRPLVLLHGFLGSARNLATLARGLAERRPDLAVVALDLTGHGASPPLPAAADTAALAADVLASAHALGLGAPLAIVGHSLGGRVALRAAAVDPAAVSDVTLLDIAPGPVDAGEVIEPVLDAVLRAPDTFASRGEARAALVTAGLAPELADWLLLNLEAAADRYRWRVDRRALAALHARSAREDLWPVVEGPRQWSLRCVRGAASPYVNERDAQRLQAAGCPVVTIDGAGHFLHAERPREVVDAVAAGLG
jgi:pimeloyl-ACP methyl ester carboxylesterase